MKWGLNNGERIEAIPKGNSLCPICNSELIAKCGVVKSWHWAHKNLIDCDLWSELESEWHLNWKNEFEEDNQEVTIEKDGIKHRADIYLKHKMAVIELQNSSISPDDICDREKFYGNMLWLINGNTLGKNFEIIDKKSYLTFEWKNPPQSFFYANKDIYVDVSETYNKLCIMKKDAYQRVKIVYDELKNLINQNPNEFDFDRISKKDYVHKKLISNEIKYNEVIDKYNLWTELSEEIDIYNEKLKIFGEEKVIFYIKKLYKEIPCRGWGYLISKEEFLNKLN